MKKAPEQYRREHPIIKSDKQEGNNGLFVIPHHRIKNYFYQCLISDGIGWEHVSVTLIDSSGRIVKQVKRCCTWEEMCFIKEQFWNDEEAVMQLHPPKEDWISNHEYCLHLWKPVEVDNDDPEETLEQEAIRIMQQLLPPDKYGEDPDCERLASIIEQLWERKVIPLPDPSQVGMRDFKKEETK